MRVVIALFNGLARDVLKSAKKSIFALHRGNMKQARSEIEKASKCANKIQKEFLEAQPSLRKGSYGNSVEEWAEARLFEYWLLWVSDSEKKRVPFLLHGLPILAPESFEGSVR